MDMLTFWPAVEQYKISGHRIMYVWNWHMVKVIQIIGEGKGLFNTWYSDNWISIKTNYMCTKIQNVLKETHDHVIVK